MIPVRVARSRDIVATVGTGPPASRTGGVELTGASGAVPPSVTRPWSLLRVPARGIFGRESLQQPCADGQLRRIAQLPAGF